VLLKRTTNMQTRSHPIADLVVGTVCGCTLELGVTTVTRHVCNVVNEGAWEHVSVNKADDWRETGNQEVQRRDMARLEQTPEEDRGWCALQVSIGTDASRRGSRLRPGFLLWYRVTRDTRTVLLPMGSLGMAHAS
jgi:hypothetical protein